MYYYKSKLFKLLFALIAFTFFAYQVTEAINLQTLPCRPNTRGFFYSYQKSDYRQLLTSDMPYEVMIGYILADSIVKHLPGVGITEDLIKQIGRNSDTMAYILKYLYLLADYDPIRYQSFLMASDKDVFEMKNTGTNVLQQIAERMKGDPRIRYIISSYILHVKVDKTEFIDSSGGHLCSKKDVAYCTVLDTIKGQILPNLNTAILSNGQNKYNKNSENTIIPQRTEFVFSYCHQWNRSDNHYITIPIGASWIKPNREYIIFVTPFSICGDLNTSYYAIAPIGAGLSHGMYPIENGFVFDEGNSMGRGERVPVQEFKDMIRRQIDSIINYDK